MTFNSVLNLLSIAFNPAFLGNYAITTMAVMLMFEKYRTALFWIPSAITMVILSESGYTKFLDLIEEANASHFPTLYVKYNFHAGYVDMLEQFMKESNHNMWLYDYSVHINRLGTFLQICTILGMSAYIISYSPYNLWMYKRIRWEKFVKYYVVNALFTCSFGILYLGLGLYRSYTLPDYTLYSSDILMMLPLLFIVSTQLALAWIKIHRANMIEHYLSIDPISEADDEGSPDKEEADSTVIGTEY